MNTRTPFLRTPEASLPPGRAARRPSRGVTLIDCLIYVTVVMILVGAATTVFFQALKHTQHLRGNTEDIARTLRVGERWRADVRTAAGPLVLEPQAAGPVLHIPQAQGRISYAQTEQGVIRVTSDPARSDVVLPAVRTCEFLREVEANVVAWRWEIELPARLRAVRVRPLFTFVAVPPPEEKR